VYGRKHKCKQNLVKNPEARRVTRKPKYRQEDNIKVNLKDAGWEGVD
jgi:hypothetical protein